MSELESADSRAYYSNGAPARETGLLKKRIQLWQVAALLGLGGAVLFVVLLARHGAADIAAAVAAAGWGVAAVVAFHIIPLGCDVMGWRVLLPRGKRLRLGPMMIMRWMGESVSMLLPVAQVGGDIARIELAANAGLGWPLSTASVVGDITVSIATQVVFTLSGLTILLWINHDAGITGPALVCSAGAVAVVAIFYGLQRRGMFRMGAVIAKHLLGDKAPPSLTQHTELVDEEIRAMYGRRSGVAGCCAWTMLVWITGGAEVWIALAALGEPRGYGQAYVIESLGQGLRSVAFMVPGALGVQEGGYLVICGMLGISPKIALGLALIRRVRELCFGVPGLMAWQWTAGRRWIQNRTSV